MRHSLPVMLLLFVSLTTNGQPAGKNKNCNTGIVINNNYRNAAVIDSIMKKYAALGVPGTAITIYSAEQGWWEHAEGYANIEKKTAMQPCHLQYLQSVSKTYLAVAILQLKEKGKIELDAPMTKYLPLRYSKYGRMPVR